MTAIVSAQLIVGMEVHVELATRTKVFTRAGNPASDEFADAEPNTLIDPVVLGLPGTLPVLNQQAVEASMLVGLALGCEVDGPTHWDRKSYLYPDLPKGYQISQYDHALCRHGMAEVFPEDARGKVDMGTKKFIRINRAHLEEDAGKLLHEAPGGGPIDFSIIDFNRAGTPLLEIVTEPDFRSVDEVVGFARQLRLLCRHLEVSRCIMQKGQIRFEPNINMHLTLEDGREVFTPIVEIKNLNSFRALSGAIDYETQTQPDRWTRDGLEHAPGAKTTRGWDPEKNRTVVQRTKEDAHNYRYFPEPDLPPVFVDEPWEVRVRSRLVETPMNRLKRWVGLFGLDVAGAWVLLEEPSACAYFDFCVEAACDLDIPQETAGTLVGALLMQVGARLANERQVTIDELGISSDQVSRLVQLRHEGSISAQAGARVFEMLCDASESENDPYTLAEREGLLTIRDDAKLDAWITEVLEKNPSIVEQIRSGKAQAIGRLIGAVMKLSGGAADAAEVRRRLIDRIGP
jgi:aspartyl-tRNA(Asn)/glutamyl-tRNA(Gln) amidotransferase subunit B